MSTKKYNYWFIACTVATVDRITKYYALRYLAEQSYKVNDYMSFDLMINRGISWGLLHSVDTSYFLLITVVSIIVTIIFSFHAYYLLKRGGISLIAYVCIIVGSLSNIIDRFIYGGVIDFIACSYHGYYWPVFNIADIAIVVGVCSLFFRHDA